MKISRIFKLKKSQFELDFVDIDISMDTPLFLDPYFIGQCSSPLAVSARDTIYSFFQLLITYLKLNDIEKARRLFAFLHEPNETCFGLSTGEPRGRGVGGKDFKNIFASLLKSRAVKTGLVEDIEDLRVFVDKFDKDKLSDMTTNILRKELLTYTENQCVLHGIPLTENVQSGYFWDKTTQSWNNELLSCLVVNQNRYLLIPKRFASYSKEYTPQKYMQHFVLNFLQNEHLQLNSALVQVRKDKKGKVIKRFVTKKSIIRDLGHVSKEWLGEFTEKHPDVFKKFKANTKKSLRILTNEELADKSLTQVVTYLKNELLSVKPGNDEATRYHRIVTSILHLIFYPNLTAPKVEQEIHEGRKRIDLRFDNSADQGFFFRLANRMPAQFILVECKNYSRDIKNPEIDQISGRFGPSRSRVGLILCRTIDDYDLFMKRCADTYRDDRGLVIPLVDEDLLKLMDLLDSKKPELIDDYLQNLLGKIVFI